jgi:hypothetical protein
MVWNELSDYGLRYDFEWVTTYDLISLSALALMVTALVALIIPAARAVRHEPERTPYAGPMTGRLLSRCKLDEGSGTVVKGSIGNENDEADVGLVLSRNG